MTLALAFLVAGGVMLLAGSRDRTIQDILQGITSPSSEQTAIDAAVRGARDVMGATTAGISGVSSVANPAVSEFEGVPVCAWIVPYLKEARRRGWTGKLNDGYRTYEDQVRLANDPSITVVADPGTSNHEGCAGTKGAVDVSQYQQFAEIMREMGAPLQNKLGPSDPVHFSKTGY